MTRDRDPLIRTALTPPPEVLAPGGLAGSILDLVETTPQRRGLAARLAPASTGLRIAFFVVALLIAFAAAALIAGTARPVLPPSILGYHGPPSRTGVMPGPGPAGVPGVVWSRQLAGPISQTATPLVADGAVYLADARGSVTILDEMSGSIRRTIRPEAGPSAGSLVIAGGSLIDGTSDGLVTAWSLDGATVRWTWRSPTGGALAMAAGSDVVVAASLDGTVYGLSLSGAKMWSLAVGGPASRSAAIDGSVAVVGADNGRLTAFDVATGQVRWTSNVGGTEVATPAIADGVVYAASGVRGGTAAYVLTALDLGSGAKKWRWSPPTANRLFVGAVDGSSVYPVSEDADIYRIDTATGLGTPLVQTGGPIGALPAIVGDVLYVASGDRTVSALDRASGATIWKVVVSGLPSGPAVIDGMVIVATDVGRAIAIGPPTGPTASR
jgi:outer membrane protein assembly factor BamB